MDNGHEYLNKDLQNWCLERGIQFETTAPHSPEQNGMAERMNRTLAKLMHAMIIQQNLSKILWPQAIQHAAYLRNQCHTKALSDSTPYQRWTNTKPDIAHFQEFGTPVWILNEQPNLSKLTTKSNKYLFMGFEDGPRVIKYYDAKM